MAGTGSPANAATKPCFVICPFGPPDGKQRKRSNMLLEYVITPAVREHGYAVIRADISAEPGLVTVHIIQHLIEDDLLIADITDHNPNVFYELAIRHSIRKPFIQVIEEGDRIPFNIQGIQTIEYDLADPDKIRKTVEKIRNQIVYYESTGRVTSPVSIAIDSMISTAGVEQFQAIMKRLEDLDSSVVSVSALKEQIVTEVKSFIEEIKIKMDADAVQMMRDIDDRIAFEKTRGGGSSAAQSTPGHSTYPAQRPNPYNHQQDDLSSTRAQKEQRRRKGEYTIGEWLDIQRQTRPGSR